MHDVDLSSPGPDPGANLREDGASKFTSTIARSSTVEYTVHVVQLYMYLGTAYALYKLLGRAPSSTIQLYSCTGTGRDARTAGIIRKIACSAFAPRDWTLVNIGRPKRWRRTVTASVWLKITPRNQGAAGRS